MTRLEKLLHGVKKGDKILEIGASHSPVVPKRKGWNAKVLDYCTKDELIAIARQQGADYETIPYSLSDIEEVDYVWRGGPLEAAVPVEEYGTFDVCIASHVIEHMPDLVGFLRSLETLLKPDGYICLAVPDKRYCFDYFQPLSTTGSVIDAMGSSRHSRGKIFNFLAYRTLQNQKTTWSPGPVGRLALPQNLHDSYAKIENYKGNLDDDYLDSHGWFFTPNSFHLIIAELGEIGLINCHVDRSYPTVQNEFFITLKKGVPPRLSQGELRALRLNLLLSTQIDLREQAFYNPKIHIRLRWVFNTYWNCLKENLAEAALGSWFAPLYQAYKHHYRDCPSSSTSGASVRKKYYEPFRDAVTYIIRRYHYMLTIRTRMASSWRRLSSTASEAVPSRVLKPLDAPPNQSVLFVTYHPEGFISDHVRHYVAQFKRIGYSVILIKVVDKLDHPLVDSIIPDADAAMVRVNAGYDFGAWAHGAQVFPEIFQGNTLAIVNDSVFGPASSALFDRLVDLIENSDADLVGLTESHQYSDHF